MWAGIGFAIIDSLGLLLCIYAIICSFGIVMIWRVPFKNNLKVTYLQSLEIPDYWVLTKLTGFALLDDLRVG